MQPRSRAARLRVIGLAGAISLTASACSGSFLEDLLDQLGGGAQPEVPTAPEAPPETTTPSTTAPPDTTPSTTTPDTTTPDASVPGMPEMPDPGDMNDPGMPQNPGDMGGMPAMPENPPVPVGEGLTPQQTTAVASTMKVVATGCDRLGARVGSGFVVGDQLIATNAHVVAGSEQQGVILDGDVDNPLAATVVAIDIERDLALLQVPGLDRPPLVIDSANVGESVDGLGYPGDALLVEPSPATVTERTSVEFGDIYGQGAAERDTLVLAGDVDPGDSGSAVVDDDGQVVGVVFGVLTDELGNELDVALAVSDVELAAILQSPQTPGTPTGACV